MSLLNFNTIKELFLPDNPSLEGTSDTNNYSAPIITANNKPINEGEIEHQDVAPLSDEEKAQRASAREKKIAEVEAMKRQSQEIMSEMQANNTTVDEKGFTCEYNEQGKITRKSKKDDKGIIFVQNFEYDKKGNIVTVTHNKIKMDGTSEDLFIDKYKNSKIIKRESLTPNIPTTEYYYKKNILIKEVETWEEDASALPSKDYKNTNDSYRDYLIEELASNIDKISNKGKTKIVKEYSLEQGYNGNESVMDRDPEKTTLSNELGDYKYITEQMSDGTEITTEVKQTVINNGRTEVETRDSDGRLLKSVINENDGTRIEVIYNPDLQDKQDYFTNFKIEKVIIKNKKGKAVTLEGDNIIKDCKYLIKVTEFDDGKATYLSNNESVDVRNNLILHKNDEEIEKKE